MTFKTYQPDNITLSKCDIETPKNLTEKDIIEISNGIIGVSDIFNRAGVYDANGNLCTETILRRKQDVYVEPFTINTNKIPFVNEKVIYLGAGYVFSHFGHFLSEGIARLWLLTYKKYQNMRVVISFDTKMELPSFVRKMLNALGVCDDNITVVYKPTRFANVIVPAQASRLECYFLPVLNRVFDTIIDKMGHEKMKTYDKIYLSRSAMNDGRTFGENAVEKVFEKNGFKIIFPEKLPLEQQITLVNNCSQMAGTAGTALHMAVFMKKGARVIQIKRNSKTSDNIDVEKNICDLRGLDLVWIYGSMETVPTEHYTRIPQIIGVTPYLKHFFDDNDFKYSNTDTEQDSESMCLYLRQINKYNRHLAYAHLVNVFIKLFSLLGITKHGRKIVREYLRGILNAKY